MGKATTTQVEQKSPDVLKAEQEAADKAAAEEKENADRAFAEKMEATVKAAFEEGFAAGRAAAYKELAEKEAVITKEAYDRGYWDRGLEEADSNEKKKVDKSLSVIVNLIAILKTHPHIKKVYVNEKTQQIFFTPVFGTTEYNAEELLKSHDGTE